MAFYGNPNAKITAIDTSGGIACSRTSGQTPCSIQVSASAISCTGTIVDTAGNNLAAHSVVPYEDLEYSWSFGDASGTEVFTDPRPRAGSASVNANADQRGGEAAYVYRSAGTYTVTLTIRGKNGSGFTTATVTQNITVTTYNASGGNWYFDSAAAGGGDGSIGLPFNTVAQITTKAAIANASLHIKRGSSWIGTDGITIAASPMRIDAYGSGANPIVNVSSGINRALIMNASGVTRTDVVVSNIDFWRSGTQARPVAEYGHDLTGVITNVCFDNCTFVSDTTGANTQIMVTIAGTKNCVFWNCDNIVTLSDAGRSTGYYSEFPDWCFYMAGQVYGVGPGGFLEHHIYPNTDNHGGYRWVDFSAGVGRSFCLNINIGADLPALNQYHLISDCNISNTDFSHDGSGGTNDITLRHQLNFVIQNNDIHDLVVGGSLFYNIASATWRDNNEWNVADQGFMISPGVDTAPALAGVIKTRIYRNNVYQPSSNGSVLDFLRGAATYTQPQQITDNIIHSTRTAGIVVRLIAADHISSGTFIDRNQYYIPNDTDQKAWRDNATDKTFAQWQAFGFDVNGSVADPQWPDPGNGDFGDDEDETQAAITTGASYLSPEELAAIRRYWEELETGRELNRKKREEIEDRLSRTIEAAYDKAMGIEPEAAKAIAAAVPMGALLPAPELVKTRTIAAPSIDWSRVAKDIDAVDRILQVLGKQIDRLDDKARLSAAQKAKLDRLRKDEQDIELLMMAL